MLSLKSAGAKNFLVSTLKRQPCISLEINPPWKQPSGMIVAGDFTYGITLTSLSNSMLHTRFIIAWSNNAMFLIHIYFFNPQSMSIGI